MKISPFLLGAIAALTGFATVSQAVISVGPAGTGTITFDTAPYAPPAATEWSTLGVGSGSGSFGDRCVLDVDVIGSTDASTITGALAADSTLPPARVAAAVWNNNPAASNLQTRATSVAYVLLMATLQNNSGGSVSALNVSYAFNALPNTGGGSIAEEIPGHRAFYSLTGSPGSWVLIPEFSSASPGTLSAILNLGSWANGGTLYLLWADDNAIAADGASAEGGYTIDNFSATPTTPTSPSPITITGISQGTAAPDYCWVNFAGSLSADGDVDDTGDLARFQQIYGLDINGAGDTLFVADRGAGKIKKVTVPGGVVTTLVGGFGANVGLVELAVNKVNGNVYFPDLNTGRIRKLVPGNGYSTATDVTTTGGFGNGLAVDSAADTVYASKTGANQIYKIANAGTSPTVTLFAGNGTAATVNGTGLTTACSINAPMGGCVVGTGGTAVLYWASRVPGSIRKINIAGDEMTTVAGGAGACTDGTGTAAGFDQPHNVVMGPDGNLYVADQTSGIIRKITNINALAGGDVTTIGGFCASYGAQEGCGPNASFGQHGQLTVASDGTIYAGDRGTAGGNDHAWIAKGTAVPGGPVMVISFNIPAGYPQCATTTTLLSSPTVDGTYGDSGATITSLGGGNFQAKVAPSGDAQFYRVQFSY